MWMCWLNVLANRSCSAPRDRQLGPRPTSGRALGSGLVASHGDGSLGWRLRRRWRQDDGRPTDRLRGRRGARGGRGPEAAATTTRGDKQVTPVTPLGAP